MAYILDGAVILIFLLAIWFGYRRGFVKSIIQLVGCIAALVIANTVSLPLANGVFDLFFQENIQKTVTSQIQSTDTSSMKQALTEILDELPSPVVNALAHYDLGTSDQIMNKLGSTLQDAPEQVSEKLTSMVIKPVAVALLRSLCFFILFIAISILASILASVINRVFRLPVLKQVNGLLGAIVGAVEGVLLILVGVTVISLVAAASSADSALTRETVNETKIVRAIEEINPATKLFDQIKL